MARSVDWKRSCPFGSCEGAIIFAEADQGCRLSMRPFSEMLDLTALVRRWCGFLVTVTSSTASSLIVWRTSPISLPRSWGLRPGETSTSRLQAEIICGAGSREQHGMPSKHVIGPCTTSHSKGSCEPSSLTSRYPTSQLSISQLSASQLSASRLSTTQLSTTQLHPPTSVSSSQAVPDTLLRIG